MRLNILWIFTVFIVLTEVRRLAHAVSAPSNVSVKCNSYGVMVEWLADPREQVEFQLELKPDFGEIIFVSTNYPRYNISTQLQDTAHNRYYVKVKARDGDHESEIAQSQIFSFNVLETANIFCGLEFPAVSLVPRDGKLFVQFTNPLHLYRETPALRNLLNTDKLLYTLISSQTPEKCLKCPFDCPLECFDECPLRSDMCESNASFPEEQEEYCITLLGKIRQTRMWETEPKCYKGKLNPGPTVTTYLTVVLGSLAVILTLVLATVFLVKFVSKIINKKSLSKFPPFLENMLTHTPLITPLKMDPEPVAENLRVEPAVKISLNSTCCLQESTTQPETSVRTNIDDHTDNTEDMDNITGSRSSDLGASLLHDSCNAYGNGEELSGSGISADYDRPHNPVEMSPGDKVNNYGSL